MQKRQNSIIEFQSDIWQLLLLFIYFNFYTGFKGYFSFTCITKLLPVFLMVYITTLSLSYVLCT